MSQAPTDPAQPTPPAPHEPGLDAAQQSLSDALRVSFTVLKVLMFFLMLVYIFSGIFRVEGEDLGVRYRFGEQVGTYQTGWHFGLPFPIEETIVVPGNLQSVRLDESFWYNNPDDKAPEELAFQQLNPLTDSFLITGDTNVVHVQFEVGYTIDRNKVDQYLRNVGSLEKAQDLVRTAAERGMIHSIASAKIEDIITKSKFNAQDILARTQGVLTDLETGIKVQQVLIDNKNQSMPNQVREAYNGVTQAQADKVRRIQEARRAYDETLGRTAGRAHTDLLVMIRAYESALGQEQSELAKDLRAALDGSIRELQLPDVELLGAIRKYQASVTAAAGSSDAVLQAAAKTDADALRQALSQRAEQAPSGQRIAGEIAAAISKAKANRSEITTQARLDYERYASALDAYRKTPLVLANDRLQATREKVMSGLVQTIVGPITRVNTAGDPEVQKEIAEAELADRRERAKRQEEEESR